jgi:hypothetical protein
MYLKDLFLNWKTQARLPVQYRLTCASPEGSQRVCLSVYRSDLQIGLRLLIVSRAYVQRLARVGIVRPGLVIDPNPVTAACR